MPRPPWLKSYRWVVLAVSFVSLAIAFGERFTFSVFFVALLEDFSWSRAQAAGIFSLNMIVAGIAAPLAGVLVDRFSPKRVIIVGALFYTLALFLNSRVTQLWQFYLSYGLLSASAFSFVGTVSQSRILISWFGSRGGTAMGFAFAGGGIGILVLVPLSQYLILRLSWRWAYVILGLIIFCFIFVIPGLLLRDRPPDKPAPDKAARAEPDPLDQAEDRRVVDREWASRSWTMAQAARTGKFWLLFTSCFLNATGLYCVLVHQVAYLVDKGMDKMLVSSVFGLTGVFAAAGRMISGAASDRFGREQVWIFSQKLMIISFIVLLLITAETPVLWLYVYAVLLGLGYGGIGPQIMAACVLDIFGQKGLGLIYGMCVFGFGIGNALGPWLGGFLFDLLGSYRLVFIISIVSTALASVTIWLAAPRKIRRVIGRVGPQHSRVHHLP